MQEASALGDIVEAAGSAAAGLLPGALGDIMRTLAGDAGELVNLQPTTVGLVRLGVRSPPSSLTRSSVGATVTAPCGSLCLILSQPYEKPPQDQREFLKQNCQHHIDFPSALQITYYLFFSTPAPVPTVIDFYLLRPLYDLFGPRFGSKSFALRERLGGGNFGITYEAVLKNGVLPVWLKGTS
jgi:hypothetical protein